MRRLKVYCALYGGVPYLGKLLFFRYAVLSQHLTPCRHCIDFSDMLVYCGFRSV